MPIIEQLWVTGVLVAFSVFGVKVGLGLGSQVYNRRNSPGRKWILLLGSLLVYLVLFLLMYFLVTRINLLDHLDRIMNLIRHGMLLHLAVAAGLMIWGVQLLLQPRGAYKGLPLKASLLLILPCPVCATVILLNLTLAYSIFTISPLATTLVLFMVFSGLALLSMALIYPFRRFLESGNSFLGMAMNLVALYFLMTLLVAPIYPEIKAAFTMASSNNPVQTIDLWQIGVFLVFAVILAGLGYLRAHYRRGRV